MYTAKLCEPARGAEQNAQPVAFLVDLLERWAVQQSGRTAFRFIENERASEWTYDELLHEVSGLAERLANDYQPGERLLLLYPPGLEFSRAFFACLVAGVIPVPLPLPERHQRSQRLTHVIRDAAPVAALTVTRARERVLKALTTTELPLLASDEIHSLSTRAYAFIRAASPNATAFLQYTSGSTGAPKGVVITHANMMANLEHIKRAFGHTRASRGVIWLPHYHDMGLIGGILEPFYCGFEVTLMSPLEFVQRPARWLRAIHKYRGTTSGGPSFAYDQCVQRIPELDTKLDLSSWEVAFCGAEPVRAATLEAFSTRFASAGFNPNAFLPCYGLAEATLLVTAASKLAPLVTLQLATVGSPTSEPARLVSNGSTFGDTQLRITEPSTGELCPKGTIGEICIRGTTVSSGYWNQPTDTSSTCALDGEQPYLRTGDLGFVANGELFVTGRLKDLLILRGANLSPDDLEHTVRSVHPLFSHAASAAFTVERADEAILIVVQEVDQRRWRQTTSETVQQETIGAVVRDFGVSIADLVFVKPGTIERTTSGKVSRSGCRTAYLSGALHRLETVPS